MSVNFYAHRDDIVTAWKEVLDEKSSIDWALFGYVKQSNDLEVVSKGTGLEDLAEEFNSSKILYAFTKVVDPDSEMPKFVLINWQGEGAPIARKGVCANHQSDVKSFLKGVHMTINARTEEEVEPSAILEKVSKSTTTKLSLKERSDPNENPVPVGSNYKRIQASSEINSSARESFWNQQQEEEKKRKIEERKRQEEEKRKLLEQASAREAKEAKEREAHVLKRDHEINKRREEEKNAENRARNIERENLEKQNAERLEAERACAERSKQEAKPVSISPKPVSTSSHYDEDPEEEISKRSELARRARAEEAKKLISGSSIKNARALFESNSSAGQLNQPTKQSINVAPRRKLTPMVVTNGASSLASPKDASPNSSDSSNQDSNLVNSQSPLSADKATALESSQPNVQVSEKVLPPDGRQRHDSIAEETVPEEDEEEDEEEVDDEEGEYSIENERVVYHPEHRDSIEQHALEDIQEEAEEEEAVYDKNQPIGDQGLRARALYDYQAADETEISFDPDDILTHVDKIDPGWFQGFAPDGSYGLFPANYVELLDD